MSLEITDDEVNAGSRNAFVPPGNKPLPESMLTQISVAKWRHLDTMSLNILCAREVGTSVVSLLLGFVFSPW